MTIVKNAQASYVPNSTTQLPVPSFAPPFQQSTLQPTLFGSLRALGFTMTQVMGTYIPLDDPTNTTDVLLSDFDAQFTNFTVAVDTSLDHLITLGHSLVNVTTHVGAMMSTVFRLLMVHWRFSLPGLLWLALFGAAIFTAFWKPPDRWPRRLRRQCQQAHRRESRRRYNPGGFARHGIHKRLPMKLRVYGPQAVLRFWYLLRRRLHFARFVAKAYAYVLKCLGIVRPASNGGVPRYQAPRGHADYQRRQAQRQQANYQGRQRPRHPWNPPAHWNRAAAAAPQAAETHVRPRKRPSVWTTTQDGVTYASPPPGGHHPARVPIARPNRTPSQPRRYRPVAPTPAAPMQYNPSTDPSPDHLTAFVVFGETYISSLPLDEQAQVPSWIVETLTKFRRPHREPTKTEKEKLLKVIWDTGASISISPSRDDFVGELEEVPSHVRLTGLFPGRKS
jgi:hypothetical protein